MKKYIIKFTPTVETIKNKYKNFKGTYEVIPEIASNTGQIKSNSIGIVTNSVGCVEVAYDIPCEFGYIHPEGNGPGLWCDGTGSHTEKIQVGDCGGSSGQGGGNLSNGNNVVVPPTFYANNIVQCEDTEVDDFINNVYSNFLIFAFYHTNDFNQLVGGLCGNFSENKKADVISTLIYLNLKNISLQEYQNLTNDRSEYDVETGDDGNWLQLGNNDEDYYSEYQVNEQWPTIQNVIAKNLFVGWNFKLHPTWECMQYAITQIAIKNKTISGPLVQGQTIQIYKSSTGVDPNAAKIGIRYLITSLQNGDPVIVGVDDQNGSRNLDNTTDHFIVIVGMGSDSGGKYFIFYDNASGDPIQGTNDNNKLYYKEAEGKITGKSQTDYAKRNNRYDYIVTQIRKNKK